jgi:hypothetical protein
MFQLSRVTTERGCLQWIDRLDALAIGCAWFEDSAALDQKKRKQERDDQLLEATINAMHQDGGRGLEALAMGLPLGRFTGGRAVGGVTRERR